MKVTATTEIYTLSLHDALPICKLVDVLVEREGDTAGTRKGESALGARLPRRARTAHTDRKSTRLNSSHSQISYAVFCLKKKKRDKYTEPWWLIDYELEWEVNLT